jgi:hypothetical protein
MAYRDDRDALKSRVAELERQLADARRRGEQEGREAAEARAGELQDKLAGLRGDLDRMEAELRALRRDTDEPRPNRAVWGIAAVPILLALIGGLFVVFVRRPPPTAPLAGRKARVTEVTGLPELKVGTECVLRVMPAGQKDACTAEVTCGATVLFPATSPVTCTYEGGRPVSVESAGGPYEITTVSAALLSVPVVVKGPAPRPFTASLAFEP